MTFCVDYRQLNERTVKDSYPLPRIDVCLDALAGARRFSTFDLQSAYHQMELDPRDAEAVGPAPFVLKLQPLNVLEYAPLKSTWLPKWFPVR